MPGWSLVGVSTRPGYTLFMASTSTVATSQESLDAILCDTLPRQGNWSDEEYLWLTDRTRRLIEFTDGYVEELPMPTSRHQAILAFLYRRFYAHVEPAGGVVMFSALRLRVREGKFRARPPWPAAPARLCLPEDRDSP